MKKLIVWLLVLTMCLSTFAGCGQEAATPTTPSTEAPTQETEAPATEDLSDPDGLAAALEYLKTIYKNAGGLSPKDYTRIGTVPVGTKKFEVVWTASVSEDLVKPVRGEDGMVTIDVNEECDTETPYTLTATITDAAGNSVSHSWEHTLPASLSAEEILTQAYALADGQSLPYDSTLTGIVTSVDTLWSEQYGNITVTMAVEGLENMPVQCYRLSGGDAKNICVGDTITVTGVLTNYKGKIEFAQGCILDNRISGGGTAPGEKEYTYYWHLYDGDRVVIYNRSSKMALSNEKTGYYNKGVKLTKDENGKLTGYTLNEVWTVKFNGYSYSFIDANGNEMALDKQYSNLNEKSSYNKWKLARVSSTKYMIENVDRKGYFLEWYDKYNNFSTYNPANPETDKQFLFSFYRLPEDEVVEPPVSEDPAADSKLTIPEAVALGAGKDHNEYTAGKYYVTGVITEVYNEKYGNMYIQDAEGNTLTVYGTYSADGTLRYDAMDVKPVAGDTVTVYGIIGQYGGTPQMKNGWITEHIPAAGGEEPDAPAESVTVSVSIAEYAAAHGWENGTMYNELAMDDVITVNATGGANTGKYYNSGTNWRVYQNESPSITISGDGKIIESVKITYASQNNGVLTLAGAHIESGAVVPVNAESVTFSVGNTGTATNGQVRITRIEVTYLGEAGESGGEIDPPVPTEPAADTELTIPQANALGESKEKDQYTAGKYYVTGIIVDVYNTTYGNMNIKDAEGNTLTVYGTYSADGSVRYDAMAVKPVAGDTVKVYGIIGKYSAPQMKNGWIVEHIPAAGGGEGSEEPGDVAGVIDTVEELTAGTYKMGGYLETYTNNGTTYDWTANPYHMFNGVGTDLFTTPYSYADGTLTIKAGEAYEAKNIELVAVEGKANTYYIKIDGKYLYSTEYNNRKLSTSSTPVEWVATNNANGGITMTTTMAEGTISLGTAGAQSKMIRSYKNESTLKYGLVFFGA